MGKLEKIEYNRIRLERKLKMLKSIKKKWKSQMSDKEYKQHAEELNQQEANDPEQAKRNLAWLRESGQIKD